MEMTALDRELPRGVGARPPAESPSRSLAADDSEDGAVDADAEAALKAEKDAAMKEMIMELINMTDVERADLIDELTRKAFVLMEAGEISEATAQLQQITRISAAFQRLQGSKDAKPRKKTDDEYLGIKSQNEVFTLMQRDLAGEDFSSIFGAQAKWANFIGPL